jgi:hypothetical protein
MLSRGFSFNLMTSKGQPTQRNYLPSLRLLILKGVWMTFRTGGSIAENLRLGDNASNCDFPCLRYSLIFD